MYEKTELEGMKTSQLLEIHNSQGGNLASWKQAKSKLIDRILEAQAEDEAYKAVEAEQKGKTVKSVAVAALCAVSHYIDRDSREVVEAGSTNTYSVGLTYNEVLDVVKQEFPNAETTLECLRWYAVKIRNGEANYEGHSLPQIRPRSKRRG